MQDNSAQYKTLGSVGGAGSSAQAGGFVAGPQIAGQGGVRGDSSPSMIGNPSSGGDVRMGGHFGPSTTAAPAGSFAQGDAFAASKQSGFGSGPVGGAKAGGNILTGGGASAAAGTGYNQGDTLVAKKK